MTTDKMRRGAIWQVILLVAGLLALAAISTSSVVLVERNSRDNLALLHTVEVENKISTLLLEIRRAESAARGYLLTSEPRFLTEHEAAFATILPGVARLENLTTDNPTQVEAMAKLRAAVVTRLDEFTRAVNFVKNNDLAGGVEMLRAAGAGDSVRIIRETTEAMRVEEDRLFKLRNASADRSQRLAAVVTIAGSALVVLLAGVAIFLVRRSARARDEAEIQLRDNNLNLENTVEERTTDLREANEEIQRFAYIVSHDLRSPLVNIMGFTSELEELRGDIFRRIATLSAPAAGIAASAENATDTAEPVLDGADKKLSEDFTEALGFIKSSIGKMDRLISAILQLTREGRREFRPTPINTKELIDGIAATVAHQAQEADAVIKVDALPNIVSDRLALEQIFSNLIDNALKYLKNGVPGEIQVRGRSKLGFAIFEVEDNGRGIDAKDHQRIFDLFRRAGTQDRPGQGIGLAHVRALVRRLGGTLTVASELHKGSTFTITLPAKWTAQTRDEQA